MDSTQSKICCICGKDVAKSPRVKDGHGRYYCQECQRMAAQSKQACATQPVGVQAVAASGMAKISAEAIEESQPEPALSSRKLPGVCPNCGMRIFASRRTCLRCQMDLTSSDKVLAIRKRVEEGSRESWAGAVVAKTIKIALVLAAIAVLVLFGWGFKMMLAPPRPFDEYPTSRAAAIAAFMNDVAKGTDNDFEKAFRLIDFQTRSIANMDQYSFYKNAFAKMHDDFARKYGDDWPSLAKIQGDGGMYALEGFVVTLQRR